MTRAQRRRILRVVETLHERAYRRGFQHGFVMADDPKLNEDNVARWRASAVSRACKPPPGSGGHQPTVFDRMLMESRDGQRDVLLFLAGDTEALP